MSKNLSIIDEFFDICKLNVIEMLQLHNKILAHYLQLFIDSIISIKR